VGRIEYWHDLLHAFALQNAYSRKGMRPLFNSEVTSDKLLGFSTRKPYRGKHIDRR